MKKNCIISAVGTESLHESWISKCQNNVDLHLIVYDTSFESIKTDTEFISAGKGQKFKLIYEYFSKHSQFMDAYEYFFMPDDDVFIDDVNIDKLFFYMDKYQLDLAQPALTAMHSAFEITVRQPGNEIRLTNFVEMMQPCFSRQGLKKCFFTFNINNCGWGMDFHWASIVNDNQKKVAIIDDIMSVHTRPSRITAEQLEVNNSEYFKYLNEFDVKPSFVEYEIIKK